MNDEALQFDRADYQFASAPATACAECKQPLIQSYYELNSALICPPCRDQFEESKKASAGGRLVRAFGAGLGAAIAGAVLWWGVRKGTGYEVGLISIAIGIGVGRAVRWGARNRGGWAYQLMAVLLTYAAIAGNYVPDVYEGLREAAKEEEQAAKPVAGKPVAAKPAADDSTSVGGLAVGFIAVFVIAAVAPFLQGASNIIGLLIIGFGLWEAWKINKRVPLTLTGPFPVTTPAPTPAASV